MQPCICENLEVLTGARLSRAYCVDSTVIRLKVVNNCDNVYHIEFTDLNSNVMQSLSKAL